MEGDGTRKEGNKVSEGAKRERGGDRGEVDGGGNIVDFDAGLKSEVVV